jgi:DNA-binding transcriptional regulator LsrR (DeoR family)
MESIALRARVSRSTVSRQLRAARDRGIVRISVTAPGPSGGLAEQLERRYGVRAYVVPVRDTASDSQRLVHVARFAARLLSEWFGDGMTLGVAWGATVSMVMEHLVPKATRGATVVQLNGAVHAGSSETLYVSALLGRASEAFDAQPIFFPVPAFFDDPATKAALWRERSIANVVAVQRACDIVVFGIGSWSGAVTSQVYLGGYLDHADLTALKAAGAVGDVCTTFFRIDGTYADLAINARGSGPDLAQLAALPRRLCVVADRGRVPGAIGALRAGVVSDLVIDEQTARAVLDDAAGRRRST